jgi:hypothetical protein
MIAALPTAAGAVYIILAIEHPSAFIASSAIGTIVANAAWNGVLWLTRRAPAIAGRAG